MNWWYSDKLYDNWTNYWTYSEEQSFVDGITIWHQRQFIINYNQFYCFSWFFVFTKVLHYLETEADLHIHVIFYCFYHLLCYPCFLQVIVVNKNIALVRIHNDEAIVFGIIKKFKSSCISFLIAIRWATCLGIVLSWWLRIVILQRGRVDFVGVDFGRRKWLHGHLLIVHVILWFSLLVVWILVVEIVHLFRTHHSLS